MRRLAPAAEYWPTAAGRLGLILGAGPTAGAYVRVHYMAIAFNGETAPMPVG